MFIATLLCLPLLGDSCAAQVDSTAIRIEAETAPRGEVKTDDAASGKKYVRVSGDYQPLMDAPVPKTGDTFTIWARLRGTSAQLKGNPGGAQKEYEWSWDKSADWKWVRFGRHTRAELGDSVLLIRAAGAVGENEGVDCLVFTTDDAFDPGKENAVLPLLPNFTGSEKSPPAADSAPVAVTVNWAKIEGKATRANYGINLYAGFNTVNASDPAYKKNVEYMSPGIVRFHNAGKMQPSQKSWEGCLSDAGTGWDRKKIGTVLSSLRFAHQPAVLVNIPSFPASMDKNSDGFLDADQKDNYAALCADLVRIVNVENKLGVKYFEITNEWDGRYYIDFHSGNGSGGLKDPAKSDRWNEVADVYNRCAKAMKAVDPTILTGGPAAARPDLGDMHERFARQTLPQLNFFSIHAYASGSASSPDTEIYDRAKAMGAFAKNAVTLLKKLSPKRHVPVFLDEFNISWTWETRDPRMTNAKGGVFDALAYVAITRAGADSAQGWNEKDGIYGKTDTENHRRPGAEVLHLMNTYLVGNRVQTTSGNSGVVAYGVGNASEKRRSLLLVNRTDAEQTVRASFIGAPTGAKEYQRIEIASGVNNDRPTVTREKPSAKPGSLRWKLPPHSVTVLTFGG